MVVSVTVWNVHKNKGSSWALTELKYHKMEFIFFVVVNLLLWVIYPALFSLFCLFIITKV